MQRRVAHGVIGITLLAVAQTGAQMTLNAAEYQPLWTAVMWIASLAALVFIALALHDWWRGGAIQKPEPNLRLEELVERLTGRPVQYDAEGEITALGAILADIRQNARLEKLTVWGRYACDPSSQSIPLAPIPSEYWQYGQISLLDYLRGGIRRRGEAKSNFLKDWTEYSDLRFDKHEVAKV